MLSCSGITEMTITVMIELLLSPSGTVNEMELLEELSFSPSSP